MRKEVRKMLDLIDEFALRNDQDSADLMALLTCLRSNDDDVFDEFKKQTVMSLRSIMFPRCYAHFKNRFDTVRVGEGRYLGMDDPIRLDPETTTGNEHFDTHFRMAVGAIKSPEE